MRRRSLIATVSSGLLGTSHAHVNVVANRCHSRRVALVNEPPDSKQMQVKPQHISIHIQQGSQEKRKKKRGVWRRSTIQVRFASLFLSLSCQAVYRTTFFCTLILPRFVSFLSSATSLPQRKSCAIVCNCWWLIPLHTYCLRFWRLQGKAVER